jgi:hypothetical protein
VVRRGFGSRSEPPGMPFTCKPEVFESAPGRIRTSDTGFRKPLLYPLSYRRKIRLV